MRHDFSLSSLVTGMASSTGKQFFLWPMGCRLLFVVDVLWVFIMRLQVGH
jgi:hypothetical protein